MSLKGPSLSFQVIWKAKVCLGTQNGDHKIELEPPVLEISSRLRRKFGFDRFIELQLLSGSLSKSFRDDDLKKSLAHGWFTRVSIFSIVSGLHSSCRIATFHRPSLNECFCLPSEDMASFPL